MVKNKKGFTLIEILAAVTILGILTAIAVVSVTKIIENAKKEHYVTAENNVKLAAQSYVQQNRNSLPKAIGQKTTVKLKTLVDKKYIDNVVDYSKNDCSLEESYVQIFKYSQKDYSYVTYLECPSYNSKETIEGQSPHITIEFNTDKALASEKAMADITILGSDPEDVKLMSYNYKIYRTIKGASGTEVSKEVKNSGDILATGKKRVKIENMSLEDYTPGKVKIVVTATNIYGMTETKSASSDFKDTKDPKCIIEKVDETTSPKPWTKANRKITVGCDDGEGSGCVRATYSKTFKNTTQDGVIRIYDNAGRHTDCPVSVYVDVTPPSVPKINMYKWDDNNITPAAVTGLKAYSSNTWTNKNIHVVPTDSTDEGISTFTYQYKITGGTTGSGTNKDITEEGTTQIQWRACDSLNNCSEYSSAKTIKLDKTAPTVPTVTLYKWKDNDTRPTTRSGLSTHANNTWSNKHIFTEPSESTDNLSGLKEYQFTTTGQTANLTKEAANYRNIEAQGTSQIKWRACDNAGNCSTYSSEKIIKIDKTAPTCTVTGGNATWINASSSPGSRVVTAHCVETVGSGCATADFSHTYSTDISTTKAGAKGNNSGGSVKDVAGNETPCPANQTVKIDKTAPTVPSISMYKWTNNSTRPTSSSGLNSYTSGSWSNRSIFTKPSGSTDATSGLKEYQFTTTGATANLTNSVATYRNIEAEGTSYIQWRACDNAGNCSALSSKPTIKIDTIAPTCQVSGGNATWINASSSPGSRVVTAHCVETVGSGCATADFSHTYSTDISTTKAGAKGNNSGGTVKDVAGNTTSCAANQTVKIDKTNPTCGNITKSGTAGNNGWYRSNVTISKTNGSDSTSGHASTSVSKSSITSETTGTTVTLTTTDNAGNTCTKSETIKVDKTAPTCGNITKSGTVGNNGWYRSDVTISKTNGSDSMSGHASTSVSKSSITSNTSGTSVTLTTTDNAGNTCTKSETIKVDKTNPTCGNMTVSGTKGSNDWYISNVTISKTNGSDSTSGHASTSVSKSSITSDTKGTTVTLTTTDNAGNTCTKSTTIKVDKTKPTCGNISKSGTAGDNGWYKSNVTLSKTNGSDSTSGHASTSLSTTSLTSNTSGTSVTLTTKDNAGNTCTKSETIKIDKTKPTCGSISVSGTKGNNNWYVSNVSISKSNGSDALSGHASTTLSKTSITSNTTGTKVTLTTKDKAGNVCTKEKTIKLDKNPPSITYVQTLTDSEVVDSDGYDFDKQSDFKIVDNYSGIARIYRAHCCDKSGENYTQNYCVSGYSAKQRVEYFYNNGTLKSGDNKATYESSPASPRTLKLKTTFDSKYDMQYAFIAVDNAGNVSETKTWTK